MREIKTEKYSGVQHNLGSIRSCCFSLSSERFSQSFAPNAQCTGFYPLFLFSLGACESISFLLQQIDHCEDLGTDLDTFSNVFLIIFDLAIRFEKALPNSNAGKSTSKIFCHLWVVDTKSEIKRRKHRFLRE